MIFGGTSHASTEPPVEIKLDSDLVVLRSSGAQDEGEPAILSGSLLVRLAERTSVKDISLVFTGTAKLSYSDHGKSHNYDNPIFSHNFSFLPEHADHRDHSHTLNAGLHTFQFRLSLPSDLPPSLRTFAGNSIVNYKIKAQVQRGGFGQSNWTVKKYIHVVRGLKPDAVEYHATVDLDNTWPGKIMYHFTLPHKAFAAGTEIPVSIQFTPLAKGVRVLSVQTELRENTTITGKHGTEHSDSHPIYQGREDIAPGSHSISRTPSRPASRPLSRTASRTNLQDVPLSMSPPHRTGLSQGGSSLEVSDLQRRLANVSTSSARPSSSGHVSPNTGVSSGSRTPHVDGWIPEIEMEPSFEPLDSRDLPPEEIHMVLKVPIPTYAAPSNNVAPCTVTHRIKWACLILNADGHTSELRCALPIIVQDRSLQDEIQLATSGARNLLFGESGALIPDEASRIQADLPSYQDHILDRVPHPLLNPPSRQPNPWAASEDVSPNGTPIPSRPSSPTGMRAISSSEDVASLNRPEPSPFEHPYEASSAASSSSSSNVSRFFLSRRQNSTLSSHSTHSLTDDTSESTHHGSGLFKPKPRRSLSHRAPTNANSGATLDSGRSTPVYNRPFLLDYYNAVPSYEISGVWANGGVTPLESLRGLPTYEQLWASASTRTTIPLEHI